jgi:signal transduction histidine kinase
MARMKLQWTKNKKRELWQLVNRLSGRIFLTFSMALILLSLVFSGLATHFGERMVIENSSNELRVLAAVLSQLIQKQFSSLENSLNAIQDSVLVQGALEFGVRDRNPVSNYLNEQRTRHQMFEDLMLFDRQGLCVGSTDPDWFRIRGEGQSFFETGLDEFNFPPIYGSDSDVKVQLVTTPVVNDRGDTLGVLVASIRMNTVYELMDQKIGLTENRDAFLLDSELRFITPGKAGPRELVESHLASTALKEHLRDDAWVGEYSNYDGHKVQGTVLKILGYSWYVVVERKYEGIVQAITVLKNLTYGVTASLIIVFLFASLVLSQSVSKPILSLVEATHAVGQGELNRPVVVTSSIHEVSVLAVEFERMRQRVARSQGKLLEQLEVSESLRLESERLASIGVLASTLAHEIRNPLNAMNLLVARIKNKNIDTTQIPLLDGIQLEIKRLDGLVNGILDYARPVNLKREVQSIDGVIYRAVTLYDELLKQKGVGVLFEPCKDEIRCSFDFDQILQCVINGLQNALEAMPSGGVVQFEWFAKDKMLHLCVRDQGAGIHAANEKKLFSPFFSTKVSGNGVGLSQIQKIILAHGGQVGISSDPQYEVAKQGFQTTLHVQLPLL